MHRIDGPGHSGNQFTEGDGGLGVPATQVTGDWLNDVQESLAQAIEGAGITLSKGQGGQLLAAILALGKSPVAIIAADCKNNSGTPNTQYDLDARSVTLRSSAGNSLTRLAPGAITNNTATAGPAANGRDQPGVFSAGFLHFYWIWNGTTLATISSTVAPPTGPTLPSGYTHSAYAGAVYYDGAALKKVRIKGARAWYEAQQAVLSGGTATTETVVSLAAVVPSNALSFSLAGRLSVTVGVGASGHTTADLKVVSGSTFASLRAYGVASSGGYDTAAHALPNVSQQLYYQHTDSGSTSGRSLDLWVSGYVVPNGGE